MEIEFATEADIPTIRDFQLAMARESEGLELDAAVVLRGVTEAFRNPAIGFYLVAKDAAGVIGCTLIQREWSDWRARWVFWIHSLYVRPERRRDGVFRRFYDHLRGLVDGRDDLGGIRLFVDHRNEKAKRAYEKVGMKDDHYALYEWLKE